MDFINNEQELMKKNLEISETYEELSKYELSNDLIPVITELKNDCKIINNFLYFYLFDIMLADIYIKNNELDNALELMIKDFEVTSDTKSNDINISILERIIYVYITKQFFQSALTYALLKKKYFDNPSNDVINRWYLEMAYIHEALGEKNRALIELTSILENNPDDELTLTVLCNITKLFIDEGNIKEALSNLSDCFTLSFKLQDEKSSKYCEYLRAKIYRLQKEFNKALKTFNTLFNNLDSLEEDNFNYLNEYIILLSETNSFNEAKKLCEKFIDKVNDSRDLYNKKLFYENYLRVRCNLITKQKNNFDYLFDIIKKIENEINKNNESKINEIKDTELSYELKNESKKTLDDFNNLINEFSKNNENDLRKFLMNHSKVLENYLGINECLYLIFSENNINIIPTFSPDTYYIKSYNYKNSRLYERKLNYDDLENTAVINVLNSKEEVLYDFTDTPCKIVDPVYKKSYLDMQYKYLNVCPLLDNNECFGCCIYLSKVKDITSNFEKTGLSLGTKILEKGLLNIFKSQNIMNQKGLIDSSLNGVCLNIFYQNIDSKKIFIPEELNEILNLKNTEISFDDYYELIDISDRLKYQDKINAINNKESYKVEYHLNINGKTIAILEQANPYNEIYYYGTISNVDITKKLDDYVEIASVSLLDDFNNDIKILNDKANDDSVYNFICFKASLNNNKISNNIDNISIDNVSIIKEIANILTLVFRSKVYLLNNIFVVINEQKTYSKYVKEALRLLNKVFYVDNIKVKLDIKEIMLSYPKHFNNLNEASDLISYLYNNENVKEGKNKFDNNEYNDFINYKTLNDCVYQSIINNNVINEYVELFENEKYLLALPVIKGIDGYINTNNINYNLKIQLEEILVQNIINEEKENVFVNISIETLNNLIINYQDNDLFKKVKITFMIDKFDNYGNNNITYILKKVRSLNHDVYIDYHNIESLPIAVINNNLIKGLYNVDNIEYINLFSDKLSIITVNNNTLLNNKLFDKVYILKI